MFSLKQPVEPKKLANVSGYDTSSNQEAIPVTMFAGVAKIPLTWISPFYSLTSKTVKQEGKKGAGAAGSQKKWYADIAGAACVCPDDAPVDAVLYVLVNDEIAFTGPLSRTGGAHYAALTLETYCQAARCYWGTKDQPTDNLILTPRAAAPVGGGFNSRNASTWPAFDAAGDPWVGSGLPPGVTNPRSGHYDLHPAYRNQCYFVFRQFFLGSSPNMPNVSVILARGSKFFGGTRFEAEEAGVNPMGFAYELLVDDLAGAGLPEISLTASTFQDTATALTAAGILIAPVLRQVISLRAFLQDFLKYYDGFWRRRGSFLEAGYFDHGDIDQSGLLTLGNDDLTEEPSIQPRTLDDTKNHADVVYTNRTKWYGDDTESARHLGNFFAVGEKRLERIAAPFVIDPDLAQRMATEAVHMLAALDGGAGSGSALREKVATLLVGDRFKLNSGSFGLTMLMRCLGIDQPADKENVAKLSYLVELADWKHLFIQPGAPKDPDFLISAFEIDAARVVDLPSQLRDVDALEVAVLALRPSAEILGFRTHISKDGVTYDVVEQQRTFAVQGKIVAEDYPATGPILDTTVGMVVELYGPDLESIVSLSDQQRDDVTGIWVAGNEFGSWGAVTPLGGGQYRIFGRRAIYGTAQAAHAIGDEVWFVFRDHLAPIAHAAFVPGDTVHFKLQPFTATENVDVAGVTPIDHTFGAAPFVLSGLEVNDQGGDLVFAGRDPRFKCRIFSAGGVEISGPQLSLGSWDDRFGWFELRARDADTGDVVWTGQTKVPEAPWPFDDNARAPGGPRNRFFFGFSAVTKDGLNQTPWLENDEPFENVVPISAGGSVTSRYDRIDIALNPVADIDFAGIIVLRHKTDPNFGLSDAGVEIAFLGPGPNFAIPQPEATTWYYRSAAFDAFTDPALWPGWPGTSAALYALLDFGDLGAPAVPFTTLTLTPTIPPPPIDQGSRSFTTPFDVAVAPPAGMKVVYAFDRESLRNSAEWPGGIGSYGVINIARTCALHWRGIDAAGVLTQEGIANFTLVASGSGGTPTCAAVSLSVISGTPGWTSINVALACSTPGSTIHYRKNGGALTTYTTAITLALGDSIDFYADASGFTDSPLDYYENTDLTH